VQLEWHGGGDRSAEESIHVPAEQLPFVRPDTLGLDRQRAYVLVADRVERAFPNRQLGGARLILTHSTYLVQKWIDVLGEQGRIALAGDNAALSAAAPEIAQRRGPWAAFSIGSGIPRASPAPSVTEISPPAATALLARAYQSDSTTERVALCREAVASDRLSAVAQLALASACRELQDMGGARAALDRAVELAPDWEAAHYEDGKFWLAVDDMERARDGFQRACDLMPSFSAAFSNLGATLGELDQPERALAAFQHALECDPNGFQILNNVGVVSRELGRLEDSERAFRQVIAAAPEFVFGYYNLGHTLFLAGRFADAQAAYEEGRRRDPEKNRRQGCRLALVRFANGDLPGAERDLWRSADDAPADERDDLLLEAYEIASAVVGSRTPSDAERRFLERIGAALSH